MAALFRRKQRLLKASEFAWVFAQADRSSDRYLTVLARSAENADELPSRLGLAIAKKQLKHAIDRNRIKRLARETFRQLPENEIQLDFVVMVRSAVKKLDNQQICELLQQHFSVLYARTKKST